MSSNIEAANKQAAQPSDDLLWGAPAIAGYLGIKVDRVYYLIRIGKLPVSKLGAKMLVASKRQLQRAITNTLTA
jgi:hypothetical protein